VNHLAQKMFGRKVADENTRVRVGVGVIILDDRGRLLLERRRDCGLWGLSGGRIEPGESIVSAAIREAKEETGLDVEITRLVGVYSEPERRIVTYPDNGDVVHLVDIILEARVLGGELLCSEESHEVVFFESGSLPGDIAPPAVAPIRDYLRGGAGIIR
jgi:ADP-ribose pyrophosphatase YjhB (NUDIX family)